MIESDHRRRRLRFPTRGEKARDPHDDGFTLVEIVVAMSVTLVAMMLVIPIFEAISSTAAVSQGTTSDASQVRIAIENLEAQVGSASQVCLPTVLTTAGMSAAAGFALRVEQVLSSSSSRWEQWTLTSAGELKEEQFVPGGSGTWITVGQTFDSSSEPPFALAQSAAGSPQDLSIDIEAVATENNNDVVVDLQSAVSAFSTPYVLAPSTPCMNAEPVD